MELTVQPNNSRPSLLAVMTRDGKHVSGESKSKTLNVDLLRYWVFCLHCGLVILSDAFILAIAYFDADISNYCDEFVRPDWGYCECLFYLPHRIFQYIAAWLTSQI